MLKFSMAQAFRMAEWFSTPCVKIAAPEIEAPEIEARSMSRPLLNLGCTLRFGATANLVSDSVTADVTQHSF
jgi:hypothetical protein